LTSGNDSLTSGSVSQSRVFFIYFLFILSLFPITCLFWFWFYFI